jgi:hypothetical protein
MVSQHEREKLTEAFKREPLTGAAVVFKCVAGLMVVAGLAVVGAQTDPADATATTASQPPSQGIRKRRWLTARRFFRNAKRFWSPDSWESPSKYFPRMPQTLTMRTEYST